MVEIQRHRPDLSARIDNVKCDNFTCQFCGCHIKTEINTYKHIWDYCNNCGNVFRRRKDKYFAERLPKFSGLLVRLYPKLSSILFPVREVAENTSKIYDYLAHYDSVKNTKYEGQFEYYMKYFRKNNIDINGKNILDISGGPGFLAKELTKYANKVVMTEYSQDCVNWAHKRLGLTTFRFDFNKDFIHELTEEKFDIVLIRYAINFCIDIRSFLSSLKNILNDNAIVVVNGFVPPTLGTCIRWQFDDYTYIILYNPETIEKLFLQEGFIACSKDDYGSYHYMKGVNFFYKLPALWYRLLNRKKAINRELIQKNLGFTFKLVKR